MRDFNGPPRDGNGLTQAWVLNRRRPSPQCMSKRGFAADSDVATFQSASNCSASGLFVAWGSETYRRSSARASTIAFASSFLFAESRMESAAHSVRRVRTLSRAATAMAFPKHPSRPSPSSIAVRRPLHLSSDPALSSRRPLCLRPSLPYSQRRFAPAVSISRVHPVRGSARAARPGQSIAGARKCVRREGHPEQEHDRYRPIHGGARKCVRGLLTWCQAA